MNFESPCVENDLKLTSERFSNFFVLRKRNAILIALFYLFFSLDSGGIEKRTTFTQSVL